MTTYAFAAGLLVAVYAAIIGTMAAILAAPPLGIAIVAAECAAIVRVSVKGSIR